MAKNKESLFDFDIKKIVMILCDYLGIPKEKQVMIHVMESKCRENAGLFCPIYDKHGEIVHVQILISTYGSDVSEQLMSLCHEMIHAKQYLLKEIVRVFKKDSNGRMYKFKMNRKCLQAFSPKRVVTKTYVSRYLGEVVHNLNEIEGPLEVEAYGREKELLNYVTAQSTKERYQDEEKMAA
jgi:hypothetical protein